MLASGDRRAGVGIVGLDCDDHIKFFSRIIEPLDCCQQLIDHTRFASKRSDDSV